MFRPEGACVWAWPNQICAAIICSTVLTAMITPGAIRSITAAWSADEAHALDLHHDRGLVVAEKEPIAGIAKSKNHIP